MTTRRDEVVTASPEVLRVSPVLAQKIGLNESIVLMQLDYLIGISTSEERDGKQWTYQQWKGGFDQMFPWMAEKTLRRCIATLKELGLVETSRRRMNWYTVNRDELAKLTGQNVSLEKDKMSPEKRTKCPFPIHTEIPTKTPTKTHIPAAAFAAPPVVEKPTPVNRQRKDGTTPLDDPLAEAARAAWFADLREQFTALARHEYTSAATVIRAACRQYGPDAYACWLALIATSNGDFIGPHLVAKNIGGWKAAGKPSAYALWGRKNGASNDRGTNGIQSTSGPATNKYREARILEDAIAERSRSQRRPVSAEHSPGVR